PQAAELAAHLDQGGQRVVLCDGAVDLGALFGLQDLFVAVEPAAHAQQARGGRAVLGGLELGQFLAGGGLDDVGVARHDLVAVRDDALQGAQVDGLDAGFELELGGYLLDLGEPEELQHADVAPADVEFVPLGRELGRGAVRVVVVVQLFAADDDAPRKHVGAGVGAVVVAVAPVVADAVDHAG